eukprot:3646225-Rhodomonas_salina.1
MDSHPALVRTDVDIKIDIKRDSYEDWLSYQDWLSSCCQDGLMPVFAYDTIYDSLRSGLAES